MKIKLCWKNFEINGVLKDDEDCRRLYQALPIERPVNIWGKELYFETPLSQELKAGARDVVDPGTICFWPQGDCIAIPWGPTPISQNKECRLVSRVNIMGKLEGDLSLLDKLESQELIVLKKGKDD